MIINRITSKKVLTKLTKMKEISKLNISQQEMDNYFHTINMFNTLERDENIVGNHVLSKYLLLKQFEPLVLPSEITISNSTKQINLLSAKYRQYKAEHHFGYDVEVTVEVEGKNGEVETKTVVERRCDVELLSAADFNVLNDAIAGAFKKSADLTDVETLKETASIDNFVDREMQHGKCAPKTENYVPVELDIHIAKDRYLTEDADEELLLWFENKVFRTLKK